MTKNIILSIRPKFAEEIFNGKKLYEYRRVLFKHNVYLVFVYATAPIKKIIGQFEIKKILVDRPEIIWSKTKEFSGTSQEEFQSYFMGTDVAYAISIKNAKIYEDPRSLLSLTNTNTPPQSFKYV